jgi:hypothetical protein
MPIRRIVLRPTLALAPAALLSLLCLAAPTALAAGPATVTVRVVGPPPAYQALVPITTVTTNTTPVVNDHNNAHACSGTSAAGALQLATAGNWTGKWFEGETTGYLVETIAGTALSGSYWNFWHNNAESTVGVCGVEPSAGDSILFFPECFEKCTGSPPSVLSINAPATAEVGKPVTVEVLSYPNPSGAPVPEAGATVTGGGESSQPTDAHGRTTMTFSGDERFALYARGPAEASAIPAEAFICIHEGNDGTCGTTAPAHSSPLITPPTSTTPLPLALPAPPTAKIAGVKNGHTYTRHTAPRLLTGTVTVPANQPLSGVKISLKRRYRGRCSQFSGSRRRFVAIRCKAPAAFFSAGKSASFSYLLPGRLPKGSYTYEIEAIDGAGQTSKLTAGVSSVVFDVR